MGKMKLKKFFLYAIFFAVVYSLFSLGNSYSNDSSIENRYLFLEFYYKDGNFSLVNKTLESGYYPNSEFYGEYKIKIFSENKELYSNYFDPSVIFSDDFSKEVIEGGVLKLNESNFYLVLPYFDEAEKIEILNSNNEKIFENEVYDVGAESCRVQ